MSVSLLSRNVARKLLFIQLLAVMASGLLFSLKDPFWGISAVCGGLAVVLPNLMFIIFAWRQNLYHQHQNPRCYQRHEYHFQNRQRHHQ